MGTVKYKKNCDLCGQPVEIEGFSLATGERVRSFCCAGCQSIYLLIYMNNHSMDIDDTKTINNEDN